MSAWLFDRLTGKFINGRSIHEVPAYLHTYYSAQGFLKRSFDEYFAVYPLFEDTCVEVPTNIKAYEKELKKIVEHYSWVKKAHSGGWKVNGKGAFLECILLCVRPDNDIFKFRVKFVSPNSNIVETWNGSQLF